MNKNFKEQQNVPAPPVTLDDINKANLDLNFLAALVKMLLVIDGNHQLDSLSAGTLSAFCSTALDKIEGLQSFMESIHKATPRTYAQGGPQPEKAA